MPLQPLTEGSAPPRAAPPPPPPRPWSWGAHVGQLPRGAPPPPRRKCFRPRRRSRWAAAPLPPLPPEGDVWEEARGQSQHSCCCWAVALRRGTLRVRHDPPTFPLFSCWLCLRLCVIWGVRHIERNQVAGLQPTQPLEGRQKQQSLFSLKGLWLVQLVILVPKNAHEAKQRILCASFLFLAQQRDKPQPGLFAPGSECLHWRESSDLGLRTEICLKMLARRDHTGLGTEAK